MILLCILWMAFWTICDLITIVTVGPIFQLLGLRPIKERRGVPIGLYPTQKEVRQFWHNKLKASLTHRYEQIKRILGVEEADKWWAKNAEERLRKSEEDIDKELPYTEEYFTGQSEERKAHAARKTRKLLRKYE